MIDREQRNGESYAAFMYRLKDELESEVSTINEHIYRLTCMILDEVPICKELEGALPVFIDRKKKYEEELNEVKKNIDIYGICI